MSKISVFITKRNAKKQLKHWSNVSWRNSRLHAKLQWIWVKTTKCDLKFAVRSVISQPCNYFYCLTPTPKSSKNYLKMCLTSDISTNLEYMFCSETWRVATLSRSKWAVKWRLTGRRDFPVGVSNVQYGCILLEYYWLSFILSFMVRRKEKRYKSSHWEEGTPILMVKRANVTEKGINYGEAA